MDACVRKLGRARTKMADVTAPERAAAARVERRVSCAVASRPASDSEARAESGVARAATPADGAARPRRELDSAGARSATGAPAAMKAAMAAVVCREDTRTGERRGEGRAASRTTDALV
jgi:hypothetical protein